MSPPELAANGERAAVEKSCAGCHNALMADYGYSNYTTEGTEFFCMVGAHPEDGFDRWFGEDARLLYAAECSRFTEGEPATMDVDGEDYGVLALEHKALYDDWKAR